VQTADNFENVCSNDVRLLYLHILNRHTDFRKKSQVSLKNYGFCDTYIDPFEEKKFFGLI
jgi:hypothetical protein